MATTPTSQSTPRAPSTRPSTRPACCACKPPALLTDYATPLVEILKDNSRPVAAELYATLDMPFATLIWQLTSAAEKSAA
jgi:hypothetical protein